MGLISKEVMTGLSAVTIKHFEDLGYEIPRFKDKWGVYRVPNGTKILVKVSDLMSNSTTKVLVACDNCGKILVKDDCGINYQHYKAIVKDDGKCYCKGCIALLFSAEKARKTRLSTRISFQKYNENILGDDFLEKYWDYEKNNINPDEVGYGSIKTMVWIKCQNKDKPYHESYPVSCLNFSKGAGCPYCNNTKVHKLDSLGTILPKSIKFWSDKNNKSPYEYSPYSRAVVYWKCHNNKHNDFERRIGDSARYNFCCPQCQNSKGEYVIGEYLIYNNIKYKSQKSFKSLIGLGGGLLSYDFYLPEYNLLIEYQGEQHEKPVDFFGQKDLGSALENFKKQQEHDRRLS